MWVNFCEYIVVTGYSCIAECCSVAKFNGDLQGVGYFAGSSEAVSLLSVKNVK